ncbi:RsfA family transcriptional regulator [Salipaludibacillus keqinensis]|uniref:RsfA family transcriptional regulator n=1 Tax=Salipaludibacillus keqinensis TaxID=2045207 RepID=A0A323THB5_9BACI|nr:RsfA family transcriptional regulator [Salipaludibacillus keqinensis]PYZ94159.1 RsfA family transcriptional regulator [Salipaludibacillus keqinensis]
MKVRQDAWSHEDDLLLAETVLRHIREGSTQLNAFDEVGDALNRTSAACGFRWNAVVRDKYDEAIKLAKKHRKQRKRQQAHDSKPQMYQPPLSKVEPTSFMEDSPVFVSTQATTKPNQELTLDEVISFLKSMQGTGSKASLLEQENNELKQKLADLKDSYSHLKQQYQGIEEDYQSIIQIMDRARRMTILEEDPDSRQAAAFRMDKNGNLEKVAK